MGSAKSTPSFVNGKPSFPGYNKVHPMFNGILFRLSDTKKRCWAFYNDSLDQIIHVAIIFDYDSQITALGSTKAYRIDQPLEGRECDKGKYIAEVDVLPLETAMFVKGKITGWNVDTLEARSSLNEQDFRL